MPPSSSTQLHPTLPVNLPQPVPRPRAPSPPSHGILGTLSAQPPQALLEDDEEPTNNNSDVLPLSQVHTLLQSLQPRLPAQPQPLHTHSTGQVAPQLVPPMHAQVMTTSTPALMQRHISSQIPLSFLHTQTSLSQQQKGVTLQQKLQQLHHQQPSPQIKVEPFSSAGTFCPHNLILFQLAAFVFNWNCLLLMKWAVAAKKNSD